VIAAAAGLHLPAFAADVHSSNGVVSGNGTVVAIEGEDNAIGNSETNVPFPNSGFDFPPFVSLNPAVNPPNWAAIIKSFNTIEPLDVSINMLNTDSTTEFIFGEVITNNTPFTWTDYHVQAGFGSGAGFAQLTGNEGIHFDVPDSLPTPNSTAFANVNHEAGIIEFSNGQVLPGATFALTFSADFGDSTANTPASALFTNPPALPFPQPGDPDPSIDNPGYAFTFRQFPTTSATSGATPSQPMLPQPGADPLNLIPFLFPFNTGSAGDNLFWIDPIVAVGYDYEITGSNVTSIVLPAGIGDDQYDLHLDNGGGFAFDSVVSAGVAHDFAGGGVSKFRILGIEPGAGLDPEDPTAFVTGLTFGTPNANVQVSMLPRTFDTDAPGEVGGDTGETGETGDTGADTGDTGGDEGIGTDGGDTGDTGGDDAEPLPSPGDTAVPEPSTMVLCAIGLGALVARRRVS
jgi:hypothetical protein